MTIVDNRSICGIFVGHLWDFCDTRLGQGWDTFSENLWYNDIVKKVGSDGSIGPCGKGQTGKGILKGETEEI